jgi:hypothetical protein
VGIAIGFLTVGPLDEMIPQPGSPNLFWALTELPQPFIDLHKGVQGERVMMLDVFAPIDEKATMSDAQVREAVARLQQMWKTLNVKKDIAGWLNKLATDEGQVRAARKRLIDLGLPEQQFRQFASPQVILLDEKLTFDVWRDEVMKAMSLPFWQAEPLLRARRQPKEEREEVLFAGVMGTPGRVKLAQARLDQRLGLLRCVEALRMFAAEHDGKLPARLDDIHLPLPVDPFTGKPFVYKLDGATAILRGTPPPGQENVATYNVRYEVTIGK